MKDLYLGVSAGIVFGMLLAISIVIMFKIFPPVAAVFFVAPSVLLISVFTGAYGTKLSTKQYIRGLLITGQIVCILMIPVIHFQLKTI